MMRLRAGDAMIDRMIRWIIEDLTWGAVFFATSLFVATLVGSLLVVGLFLIRLPATYFQDFHSRDFWVDRHPVLRLAARSGKNVLGVMLIVAGGILSLPGVPGQGLLTMLIGLMLIDLPGKRRLERKLVGRPRILRTINRLRKRFGRPPLALGRRRGEVLRKSGSGKYPALKISSETFHRGQAALESSGISAVARSP
jgi:UPF0716 family protein affecting phage T7 exclusion